MPGSSSLCRRARLDGKRVEAAGKFRSKGPVDHAMGLDAASPAECLGHDSDPEMGLATRSMAGMTGMKINHFQRGWTKSIG